MSNQNDVHLKPKSAIIYFSHRAQEAVFTKQPLSTLPQSDYLLHFKNRQTITHPFYYNSLETLGINRI